MGKWSRWSGRSADWVDERFNTQPIAQLTIQQAFDLALHQHQAGRIAKAEAIYRQILAVDPRPAGSLHAARALTGPAKNETVCTSSIVAFEHAWLS